MRIIDSDTHIDETENTWAYMAPDEEAFKPTTAYPPSRDPSRPPARYWIIDGKRHIRFIRNDASTQTTVETRELLDVDARLRAMDAMGVETQVIYPTLFLVSVSEEPAHDTAFRRSYNRWLADASDRSHGRLRWACLPPVFDLDQAIEELRFAREHGAAGVLKKGDPEAGKWPNDPYWFPLYKEAERLGLPICFHTGSGVPDHTPAREFSFSRFMRIGMPTVNACHSLILHGVPAQFPNLRWGFIEAGATWVPFILYDLRRRLAKIPRGDGVLTGPDYDVPQDVFERNHMYVTIQVDEDLPYLLQHIGEDHVLLGSDYTHADASMEIDFPRLLQARADRGDIPPSAVQKILYDNPRAFYGI